MKLKIKNKPCMTLIQMLRRRRTNLAKFMTEQGITTYDALVQKCHVLGVAEPTKDEFAKTNMPLVSNPEEGIIVIDPPILLDASGKEIEKAAPRPSLNAILDIKPPPRQRKKTTIPPAKKEND